MNDNKKLMKMKILFDAWQYFEMVTVEFHYFIPLYFVTYFW